MHSQSATPSPMPGASDQSLVVIVAPDGSAVLPVQPPDLAPLALDESLQTLISQNATEATLELVAKDSSAQSILSAILRQTETSTKATQVTVSLAAAVADQAIDLSGFEKIQRVKVKALAGATATLKFGNAFAVALDVAQGDDFPGLGITALTLNSPGGAGGTITLQLFGSTPPSQ